MKVSHFFEFGEYITGGISHSVEQQRKALRRRGVEVTEKPEKDSDVLHLNFPGPRSAYHAWRAGRSGVPVVMHTHITTEEWRDSSFRFLRYLRRPLGWWLDRVYPMADRLICPSEYNQGIVERHAPDVPKRVMTNGVDLERLEGFGDLRDEYLERYDLEPPVVFCVGHVLKRKGLDRFVEQAEEMPEGDFCWFGYLDRELKDEETLELVDGSPDNCTFTGFIEDIRGAYAAGDIFLYPTEEDNEGIAVLEAMATEKPVLLTDIQVFEKFEDGVECIKADRDGLAQELERLLSDPELRKDLGEAARERMEKDFSLESVGANLEEVYRELV